MSKKLSIVQSLKSKTIHPIKTHSQHCRQADPLQFHRHKVIIYTPQPLQLRQNTLLL